MEFDKINVCKCYAGVLVDIVILKMFIFPDLLDLAVFFSKG